VLPAWRNQDIFAFLQVEKRRLCVLWSFFCMSASAIYFLQQEPVCCGEELTLPAVPPSINTFSEAILPNIKMEQPLENFNALKHFLPNSNSLIFQALNLPQALPLPIFSKFSSFPLLRAYALSSSLNTTYVPFLLNTPKFSFRRILPCLPAASTPLLHLSNNSPFSRTNS
jgi:hypothetical protein